MHIVDTLISVYKILSRYIIEKYLAMELDYCNTDKFIKDE